MNDNNKTSCTASTSASSEINIQDIKARMKELDIKQMASIRSLIHGVRVIPDHANLMAPPDGYLVVVGHRLWEKLQKDLINENP